MHQSIIPQEIPAIQCSEALSALRLNESSGRLLLQHVRVMALHSIYSTLQFHDTLPQNGAGVDICNRRLIAQCWCGQRSAGPSGCAAAGRGDFVNTTCRKSARP